MSGEAKKDFANTAASAKDQKEINYKIQFLSPLFIKGNIDRAVFILVTLSLQLVLLT